MVAVFSMLGGVYFWLARLQVNKSAIKDMILNRIGDFGLTLTMVVIIIITGFFIIITHCLGLPQLIFRILILLYRLWHLKPILWCFIQTRTEKQRYSTSSIVWVLVVISLLVDVSIEDSIVACVGTDDTPPSTPRAPEAGTVGTPPVTPEHLIQRGVPLEPPRLQAHYEVVPLPEGLLTGNSPRTVTSINNPGFDIVRPLGIPSVRPTLQLVVRALNNSQTTTSDSSNNSSTSTS